MKNSNHLRLAILFSFSLLALLSLVHPAPSAAAAEDPLVVFLVRHAEKTAAVEDPELNAAGIERAADLARILRDAGIEHVHSSDFIRTRNTASPTAAVFGLGVEIYDPGDLPALVEHLREAGGRPWWSATATPLRAWSSCLAGRRAQRSTSRASSTGSTWSPSVQAAWPAPF